MLRQLHSGKQHIRTRKQLQRARTQAAPCTRIWGIRHLHGGFCKRAGLRLRRAHWIGPWALRQRLPPDQPCPHGAHHAFTQGPGQLKELLQQVTIHDAPAGMAQATPGKSFGDNEAHPGKQGHLVRNLPYLNSKRALHPFSCLQKERACSVPLAWNTLM